MYGGQICEGMSEFEITNLGVWEACAGVRGLATVKGQKHEVALPSDLMDVLRSIVQDGSAKAAGMVAETVSCFLKASSCFIRR